jgi:hypothetical protein
MLRQLISREATLPLKDLNVAPSTTPFPEEIFFIQRPISLYTLITPLSSRVCNLELAQTSNPSKGHKL